MYSLISFCDLHWWHILLSWLILFVIGLLFAWYLWGRYKRRFNLVINERDDFKQIAEEYSEKFEDCEKHKKDQKDVIDLLRKKIAELEKTENTTGTMDQSSPLVSSFSGSIYDKLEKDNLQIIEGIGPKMSEFLHKRGIHDWKTLGETKVVALQKLLADEGGRCRIIDPVSWPDQAALAASGKWNELIQLQQSLEGNKNKGKDHNSKLEKFMIRMGLLKKWKQDDLKAIEGIGPKIENLLQGAGISTWKQLAESSVASLQRVLDEGGSKFKLAEPTSWPEQAKLAAKGEWQTLNLLQEELKGGKRG